MNEKIIHGGIPLHPAVSELNFALLGASASGKTTLQRFYWQHFLPRIVPGEDRRAIMYDYKRDVLPIISPLARVPIVNMDPFDARGVPWDIAADITTPADAMQFAATVSPMVDYTNQFFIDGAQDVHRNRIMAFHHVAPGRWTLRDDVLVGNEPELTKQLLSKVPETRHVLDNYGEERTFLNVMATLRSRLGRLSPIAALWDSSKNQPVSLKGFPYRNEVILLRDNPSRHEAMMVVNSLLLKPLQEVLLSQDESRTREVMIGLDEFAMLGKLPWLPDAFLTGRSKGLRMILGFQEIDSLRKHYGREGTNELIGQCGNLSLLRVASPETAQWAAAVIGKFRRIEEYRSRNSEGKISWSEHHVEKDAVMPSEFLSMPPTSPQTGLTGVFTCPWIGAWKHTIPWSFLEEHLVPPDSTVQNFIARRDEDQILRPFDDDDYRRLGLTPVKPKGPQGNKGQQFVFRTNP
jgi:hypothetical protein